MSGHPRDILAGEQVKRIAIRAATTTVISANSTAIVAIKAPRALPTNHDYLFTPSKLMSVAASGTEAPHAVFSHDQKNVLFTNLQDVDVTLCCNTVIGHLQSTTTEDVAVWHEAAKEVRGFLGLTRIAKAATAAMAFPAAVTVGTPTTSSFNPDNKSFMPLPEGTVSFPLEAPRPRPCPVALTTALDDSPCANEV
jgi:hypothetical protein